RSRRQGVCRQRCEHRSVPCSREHLFLLSRLYTALSRAPGSRHEPRSPVDPTFWRAPEPSRNRVAALVSSEPLATCRQPVLAVRAKRCQAESGADRLIERVASARVSPRRELTLTPLPHSMRAARLRTHSAPVRATDFGGSR